MTSHTHQDDMKRFITHIIRLFWGEQGGHSSWSQHGLRKEGKEPGSAFPVVRGWSLSKGSCTLSGTLVVRISCQYQGRSNLTFLISLSICEAERKGKALGLSAVKYHNLSQIFYYNSFHDEIIWDFSFRLLIMLVSM